MGARCSLKLHDNQSRNDKGGCAMRIGREFAMTKMIRNAPTAPIPVQIV